MNAFDFKKFYGRYPTCPMCDHCYCAYNIEKKKWVTFCRCFKKFFEEYNPFPCNAFRKTTLPTTMIHFPSKLSEEIEKEVRDMKKTRINFIEL